MPVTPTIEVDDTLKERSSHGSFELPIETYTDNCEIFHSLYNHWHDEMELIYIESGSGLVRLNRSLSSGYTLDSFSWFISDIGYFVCFGSS